MSDFNFYFDFSTAVVVRPLVSAYALFKQDMILWLGPAGIHDADVEWPNVPTYYRRAYAEEATRMREKRTNMYTPSGVRAKQAVGTDMRGPYFKALCSIVAKCVV